MKRMYTFLSFLYIICLCVPYSIHSQSSNNIAVFKTGEHQETFHNLTSTHQTSLLEICDNSMKESYKLWSSTMKDIENFCKSKNLDIRGTKLWINLFWNVDGSIESIVFHQKPNSKQMDYEKLRDLLKEYVDLDIKGKVAHSPYAHFGSISFPVFSYIDGIEEK